MEIRVADLSDKPEIVALYEQSQRATGLPNPELIPPAELGAKLYARHATQRLVAVESGRIVGHGLIELPNPEHEEAWRYALADNATPLLEMGGAFVDPKCLGQGIWTTLLLHRINVIRDGGCLPVTATWSVNEHVKKTFQTHGAVKAGQQSTPYGEVDLFVFQLQ